MLSRAFRPIAATLAILLLTGAPPQAAPVSIREVIQVIGSHQNPPELRLRSVTQTTNSSVNDTEGPSPIASAAQQSAAGDVVEIADASTADIVTSDSADTLLAGVAVSADPQTGIDVVDQGDVEGTICDCGEITVPGGGFPRLRPLRRSDSAHNANPSPNARDSRAGIAALVWFRPGRTRSWIA